MPAWLYVTTEAGWQPFAGRGGLRGGGVLNREQPDIATARKVAKALAARMEEMVAALDETFKNKTVCRSAPGAIQ